MGNILIVDDAKLLRMTIADAISKTKHHVIGEAETGSQAIELYRSLQPDLVIMDITMPETDGITAVKEIIQEFPDAKIVMCSAMGQKKIVVEAIEAGAIDFVVKPFEESLLVHVIEKNI